MMGSAPQVVEQEHESLPQPLSAAEEEAVKRNTDCVYFLASPLTCKKGSECEYRHSEYARVNPRDCWFWLNGNCLNPKCSFRHPPLDGLVGTHAVNQGISQIPIQTPASASVHNPFAPSKQAVPCIFFQKGQCLKGDRCAFMHGPSSSSSLTNKAPQAAANAQASELPSVKKASGGGQRRSQEQQVPPAKFSKSIVAPIKLAAKNENELVKIADIHEKGGQLTNVNDGSSRYRATNSYPVLIESSISRTNRLQQSHVSDDHGLQNGKDVDEFLKESSPGFDVLVDDELRGSDYYGGEEQFGRTRGHDGTNMNSVNEYDMNLSADYKMAVDVDQDVYNDVIDYDYDSRQGRYGWDQRGVSYEKLLLGLTHTERRPFKKSSSPEQVQNLDLRHRLNKHRRVNGLRSVINNDNADSRPVEERSYRASRRDSHPPQEGLIGSRLRGRIKLPRLSSPVGNSNLRSERDLSRGGRHQGRLSPGRPQSSSHQGSIRDEIKGRVEDDYNERRNFNGYSSRRDRMDGTFDFAAPKSLAELKGHKPLASKEQPTPTLGKRKGLENNEQSGVDLSFAGPKPLSEILKKKRQAESVVKPSENNAESENEEGLIECSTTPTMTGKQDATTIALTEQSKLALTETVDTNKDKVDVSHCPSSQATDHDNTEGMTYVETLEDHEYEADDQRDGEYEYEQVDDGEYNYEEGDNIEAEDEYMDDEDGDDFAKTIGVVL